MFPRILFTSLSLLVSSYTFGIQADGPKVFIEVQSSIQTGTPTISMPEATSRFQAVCVDCQLTIRKDVAEYLVVVAKSNDSSGEQWLWTVYENAEGMLLQQGQTEQLDDSFGDAAKSIMENWGTKEIPGLDEESEISTSLPPEMNKPGIVYFYRKEGIWSRSQNPVIYWGGQELAKLTKNKFFAVSLEPGIHGFSVNKELPPEQRVRLQVEPGRTYFLKFSSANLFAGRGGPTFTLMNTKTAKEEFKKLKPEETKNIRDPKRVLADVRPDFESAALDEEFIKKRRAVPQESKLTFFFSAEEQFLPEIIREARDAGPEETSKYGLVFNVTINKESADYVVMIGREGAGSSWRPHYVVFEKNGELIAEGDTIGYLTGWRGAVREAIDEGVKHYASFAK